jgi:hypothetical protein
MLTDARNDAVQPEKFFDDYLKGSPSLAEIARQTKDVNGRVEALQRETARPVPYRFTVRPAR